MERYRSGRNGGASKASCPQGHVGSNPTLSASLRSTSSSFGLARLSAWPRSQRATRRRRLSRRSTRSVRRRTFCERLSVHGLQELRTPGRPPRRFHAIPRTRAWIACCSSPGLWRQSPSCMSFEAVAIQIGTTLASHPTSRDACDGTTQGKTSTPSATVPGVCWSQSSLEMKRAHASLSGISSQDPDAHSQGVTLAENATPRATCTECHDVRPAKGSTLSTSRGRGRSIRIAQRWPQAG